jgi:hypothetical protein
MEDMISHREKEKEGAVETAAVKLGAATGKEGRRGSGKAERVTKIEKTKKKV